jgi:phosphoglycolate phosphatase-like HAD superfamily hydrolase
MRLVLWDIDGTLIRARGLFGRVWYEALKTVYQLEGDLARIEMAGKTDGQIALEILALHGWTEEAAVPHLDTFRERYIAALHEVRTSLAEHVTVLPGVREALERLEQRGVHHSLLTGNYEASARLKLGSVGLDQHFDFEVGAFGSDDRDRLRLVPVSIEKGRRLRDSSLNADDVVVVGDTPRDIACARAGGVRVVAVATGRYASAELAEHRPDVLLDSLQDTDTVVEAILGG